MEEDETAAEPSAWEPTASARPPTRWIVLAVAVVVGVGLLGWRVRSAGREAALQRALTAAHEALDRGAAGTAADAVRGEFDDDRLQRPDVAWLAARLAAASDQPERAAALFERASGGRMGMGCPARAALGLHHARFLLGLGRAADAVARIDQPLGHCGDPLDDYLDRDDLDDVARAPAGSPVDPAVVPLLQVLELRVRAAVHHAEALDAAGETDAAAAALDAAEARVSGLVCSGTHRMICRGPRAGLRDRLLPPLDAARTRRRADAALAMVRKGEVDEAVDEARAAVREAAEARDAAAAADRGRAEAAHRSATTVAYAVEVEAALHAERAHDWARAAERYGEAGRLWDTLHAARPGPGSGAPDVAGGERTLGAARIDLPEAASPTGVPAHVSGLARAKTLAELLDQTDATADKLGALGLDRLGVGDADRRRLHARLLKTPLDARVYVEEALARIRRSRAPDREPAQRAEDSAAATRLLDAALAVLPESAMVHFYRGVRDVVQGRAAAGVAAMEAAWREGYRDRAAALHLAEAYAAIGRTRDAAQRWQGAWAADPDDSATARRAVEAWVALGEIETAAKLTQALRERHGADVEVRVAEALVALGAGKPADYAKARLALDAAVGADVPAEVGHGRRVAAAAMARGREALATALQPGEVVLETVFGHVVRADSEGRLLGETVQCVVLVVSDRRIVLLRWDARRDRRAEAEQGVDIVRRTIRLGGRVGRELARLQLDGLRDLVTVLEWLPEGARKERPSLVEEGAELAVATLALIDAVGQDVALHGALAQARARPLNAAALRAWSLVALADAPGLWLLRAQRKDGQSPFDTDGDRLILHHDRPELLTALLRMHLGAPAVAP